MSQETHQMKQGNTMSFGSIEQFPQLDQILDDENCSAIPFIKFMPEIGKFELDAEAEAFLKGLVNIKLGVVAVCGKYRTGKSYLLNKLFVEQYFQKKNKNSNGFQVSPTINACTKGLWLWKKVIYMQNPACPDQPPVAMIVVDTEGLGAFDEDENHDSKIFLLALLLSSLLIYNSVGTIDENALNSLSLVINLSKKVQLKSGNEQTSEDVDSIAKMFPSFLWVLRDFALKLVDNEGNNMTPKQYLDSALKEQKGSSDAVEAKNRVRRMLTHFFHERDCCTLVRPTESEKHLQTLIKLPESELREEFVEQMNRLKTKVSAKAKVKCMNGHPLNGPMLVELANSYIKALNDGEVPVIESAWTNVCHFEQERSFKEAQMCYQTQITSRLKCNKDPNIDIKGTLKQIRENAFQVLKKDFIGELKQLEAYKERLNLELKLQSKAAIKDIMGRQDDFIQQLISNRIETDLESKVRRGIGSNNNNLSDSASILAYSEELLQKLKDENPLLNHDRMDYLFRSLLMKERLPKLLESVHIQHCKTPSNSSLRTLEQSLILANEEVTNLKEERNQTRQQLWEKNSSEERERQERLMREKLTILKLQEMEEKFRNVESQLKFYRGKEMKESGNQTEKKMMMECEIQVNTIEAAQHKITFSQAGNLQSYMEYNASLLQEVLSVLNNNSVNNASLFDQPQVVEVIKNNQLLSNVVDQSEKRCSLLERKIEKKQKYEQLVKNCQRLQCKECNKLYTPTLFSQHFVHCKQRNSAISTSSMGAVAPIINGGGVESYRMTRTSSQVNFKGDSISGEALQTDDKIETPVSNQTENELFEGGCQEGPEVLTPPLTNFNEFLRYSQKHQLPIQVPSTQHLFSVKVINILVQNQGQTFSSPYFKGSCQTMSPQTLSADQVNLEFQVVYQNSHHDYQTKAMKVTKNINDVKACMLRIQKRMLQSPSEQSQITKSILEIDQCIQFKSYQKMGQIIEDFFSEIHQKLLDNNLQLNKHIIVEDIEGYQAPHHYCINEFVDFFNLQQNSDLNGLTSQVRPFDLNSIQSYQKEVKPRFSNQTRHCYPGGNDDEEVIMQTPYDEEDGAVLFTQNAVPCSGISSTAQGLGQLMGRDLQPIRINHLQQDNSFSNSINSHQINNCGANTIHAAQQMITTMHLDGEHSIDNSALHMVSFFSVDDEEQIQNLTFKKHFQNNQNLSEEGGDTSSIENLGKRLAESHPTQDEVDENDLSSSSIQQRDFEMVSAKAVHHQPYMPFQNIHNQLGYVQPGFMQTNGANIQNFVQMMQGATGNNNNGMISRAQTVKVVLPSHGIYEASKKPYQSPLQGKKSTAVGSRIRTHRPLLPTAGVTKDHQYYFNNAPCESENPNVQLRKSKNNHRQKYQMTARVLGGQGDFAQSLSNFYVDQQ